MNNYTHTEKREAIERELRMRRDVYPRWVAKGNLTQQEADYQIKIFEAIAIDYWNLSQGERLL
jgi:hypothetical protein